MKIEWKSIFLMPDAFLCEFFFPQNTVGWNKEVGKAWITLDVLNNKVDYTVNLPKEVVDALLIKSYKNGTFTALRK